MDKDRGLAKMLMSLGAVAVATGCCGLGLMNSEANVQKTGNLGFASGHIGEFDEGVAVGINTGDTYSGPFLSGQVVLGEKSVSCATHVNNLPEDRGTVAGGFHASCDLETLPTQTPIPSEDN